MPQTLGARVPAAERTRMRATLGGTRDLIDRVAQIAQHLRAATLTMDTVLGTMELVHDGPVKPFHDHVLAEIGLP